MAEMIQNINLSSGEIIPVSVASEMGYISQEVDIGALINWMSSNNIMAKYRFYVLYPDETINYEIPIEDVKADSGSFTETYQNGQRRSVSFSLYNESGKYSPNINGLWAGVRLRLDMGAILPSGETIWFQKGIFNIQQVNPTLTPGDSSVNITCSDKFGVFEDKTGTLDDTFEIPEGSLIENVIKDILLMDMGTGDPFDPKPIVYHQKFKDKRTQATISKSAGETYGSILIELATQLSAEIFYNAMGNLTIIPTEETSADADKPLIYEYNADVGEINGLNFSFDLSSIINRVIVIGSSTNGSVVRAIAVNDDPGSPLCYQRIGYRTDGVINDSNITTELLAQERAKYELRKKMIIKSSTSIEVLYNPLLSVNNLIALSCEFYELVHEKFLIQSITYPLGYNGTISISITNIKNLPSII